MKSPGLQADEIRELYLSGEAAPLMLSRIGLRVVLERNVIQSAALYLPDWPVFQHLAQRPLMAFPIVTV